MAETYDFVDEDEGFLSTGHIIILTFVILILLLLCNSSFI